ncbi:hypothetical protein V8E55_010652 [Tylopilus felleus]
MTTQVVLCVLAWAFAVVLFVKKSKSIPLPHIMASWVYNNQNRLLGTTVQHALLVRLSRGVRLPMMMAWINIARNAPFFQPRHLWWTLLSVSWSNMLTPDVFIQPLPITGPDLDFLNPTLSNYFLNTTPWLPFSPTTRNFLLSPIFSEYRTSAAMSYISPNSTVTGQFDSSIGNVPTGDNNGNKEGCIPLNLSWINFLMQKGNTKDFPRHIQQSSSPNITLNTPVEIEIPSNYNLQMWSWSTNCSGNAESYTGDVNLLTINDGFLGNGLFATSVCFFQDFYGPSNQSFRNPNLPMVCEVIPVVTTVAVQYYKNGLISVGRIRNRTLLPDDSWPLAWYQGFTLWLIYVICQSPYSNSLADDINMYPTDFAPALTLESEGQGPPDNMTIPFTGTVTVVLVGWISNPRTHCIALGVITLVTIMTVVSGSFALPEANKEKTVRDSLDIAGFDPTSLMDVLVASSMGNLASVLSERAAEEEGKAEEECNAEKERRAKEELEREKLVIKLLVTDSEGGQPVKLNCDDGSDVRTIGA